MFTDSVMSVIECTGSDTCSNSVTASLLQCRLSSSALTATASTRTSRAVAEHEWPWRSPAGEEDEPEGEPYDGIAEPLEAQDGQPLSLFNISGLSTRI